MKLHKILVEGPYLVFRTLDLTREKAAAIRHRNLATIHKSTRLHRDCWFDNPTCERDRIIIGPACTIRGNLLVYPWGGRIDIGAGSFVGKETYLWSASSIKIGNNVLISHRVDIHDNTSHSENNDLRRAQFRSLAIGGYSAHNPGIITSPIIIGDDAWIGFGVAVMKGVTVGEGAIVGAHSVVTHDVEPNSVVAGNPARFIRYRNERG